MSEQAPRDFDPNRCTWYVDCYRADTNDFAGSEECGEWTHSGTLAEHNREHSGAHFVSVTRGPRSVEGRPE